MTNVAVVLSGCGHLDGAEIREAVLSLLFLDREGATVQCFAPDIPQADVIDHRSGAPGSGGRNVLEEAARIARGKILPLSALKAADFDALVLPGGFGAAKNLSNFAIKGPECAVLPELQAAILAFHAAKKPIGAICIAPAVLAAALKGRAQPVVTIGEDAGVAATIESFGGKHKTCSSRECAVDEYNRLATCSAYMRDDALSTIAEGIEGVIRAVLHMARERGKTAA